MNELDKLREMLTEAGIPFISAQLEIPKDNYFPSCRDLYRDLYGEAGRWLRNQVIYGGFDYEKRYGRYYFDAIFQCGSYGAAERLIETYGTLGWNEHQEPRVMTAEEAFEIIRADWEKSSEGKKKRLREETEKCIIS